jgi:hypothetical protein
MKDLPLKLLVGALALMLLASLTLSERYFVLSDRPMVVHIAAIKTSPEMAGMVGTLDEYGVHLRREPSKLEAVAVLGQAVNGTLKPDNFRHMTDPAFGYSVREWSFFGMPFGFYTEYGNVLYVRNDWGTIYAPLTPEGLEKVNRTNGRDVTSGNLFPFWAHLWGWVFVAGLGLAIWLWLRRSARKREEEGLI